MIRFKFCRPELDLKLIEYSISNIELLELVFKNLCSIKELELDLKLEVLIFVPLNYICIYTHEIDVLNAIFGYIHEIDILNPKFGQLVGDDDVAAMSILKKKFKKFI